MGVGGGHTLKNADKTGLPRWLGSEVKLAYRVYCNLVIADA